MNRGLETGLISGNSKGVFSGMKGGLHGAYMTNKSYMLNPSAITDPKIKPVFFINGDFVTLTSGTISGTINQVTSSPTDLMPIISNVLAQPSGTTYRPPVVYRGLGDRNYMDFSDTNNRYLSTGVATNPALYATTSPQVSATGLTYMFVIKRKQGSTYSILDGRDSTSLPTPGDLLIEVNSSGSITFDYRGGTNASPTAIIGTSGVNLLNDWSILTIKTLLREDGGAIPSDSDGSPVTKRYAFPSGAKIGSSSSIEIYVNGVEQPKTITTNTFTNIDYYGDNTYRMLDVDITIGNKATVYGTSGTQIAACLLIPAFIDKAIQTKIENYFRWYYNRPF